MYLQWATCPWPTPGAPSWLEKAGSNCDPKAVDSRTGDAPAPLLLAPHSHTVLGLKAPSPLSDRGDSRCPLGPDGRQSPKCLQPSDRPVSLLDRSSSPRQLLPWEPERWQSCILHQT